MRTTHMDETDMWSSVAALACVMALQRTTCVIQVPGEQPEKNSKKKLTQTP
jgi:hypothetical protein